MSNSMVFCRGCGKEIHESAVTCPHCGAPQGRSVSTNTESGSLKYVLPVGRSGWAVAAGYLALFSVLLFPAPFALICGIMALRDISNNPIKIGKPRAIFGIVMGSLGTLILIGIFLAR